MKVYFVRALAALACTLFCAAPFMTAIAQENVAALNAPENFERILTSTAWTGGIDTRRPGGCSSKGNCSGSYTLQFVRMGDSLHVRFVFMHGEDAFSAAERGTGFFSPKNSKDEYWDTVDELTPNGSFIVTNKFYWNCSIRTPQKIECSRILVGADGWVYHFTLRPVAPNSASLPPASGKRVD